MELIDNSVSKTCQESVYRHGDDTVRIVVSRDRYENQSYATASVLSSDRKWTILASEPAENWHDSTPLAEVARRLAGRAGIILGG